MPDGFTTAMSVYAACEADEARQAAEAAELRAFVSGYSHVSATPAERQRYVEAVRVLYPQPVQTRPITAGEKQVIGGVIIALFAWFAVGAAVGKFYYHDVGEGLAYALVALTVTIIGSCVVALFWIGLALVCGYV